MASLAEYLGARELLGNLTQRELRGKYKRSFLGWSWSLINPLALAAIFTFIFGIVFKSRFHATGGTSDLHGIQAYPLYLLAGLLPWNYLSNGINGSIGALVGNANLVKKVYFPREILVASNVLSWLVSLFIELGVLGVALLAVGNIWLQFIPMLLVVIFFQTLFTIGAGLLLSVLNVYYRDVQHFVGIFLQLWFYATPIIYPLALLEGHSVWNRPLLGPITVGDIYKLNPMTDFVNNYHDMLINLSWPSWAQFGYAAAFSLALLGFGLAVFRRMEPRLAEEL